MAFEPTEKQLEAMYERDRTLLVSAAAGSGKTAVLTDRIVLALMGAKHPKAPADEPDPPPADISRMLIVTFTRAAASELRKRIAEKLSKALTLQGDNEHLKEQLMLLSSARISTIDSFYYDLVRANFQAAGMPPSFCLADDTELLPLRQEAMNAAVDDMYTDYPDFSQAADIFCGFRDENKLSQKLIELAEKLNTYPESAEYPEPIDVLLRTADVLEQHASTPLDTPFGEVWMREVRRWAAHGQELYQLGLDTVAAEPTKQKLQKFTDLYTAMRDSCANILAALDQKDYEATCALLYPPFPPGIGGNFTMTDEMKALRKVITAFHAKWREKAPELGATSLADVTDTALRTARVLRIIHEALRRYTEKYKEAKALKEVAEFSDVSRAAYRLLVERGSDPTAKPRPTPLAKEIAESLDAIYIDEYQDVDSMQDATFNAISNGHNLFMVGDIKQSIYRFRGAQPNVFAGYKENFPVYVFGEKGNTSAASIFMSECFRCDENVVKFANAVSGFLFSHNADGIGYEADKDDLHFRKALPYENYKSPRCRVMLMDKLKKNEKSEGEEESTESHRAEAVMVASEIARLIGKERKADGTLIEAKDIAVLMRSTRFAKPLAEELAARHIAVNDTSKRSFFENPEVLCMYSLLATIDNPQRDVYLAATLRSPFFGFTLQDLLTVRAAAKRQFSLYEALCAARREGVKDEKLAEKIEDFCTRLDTYRNKARTLPVDKLLRYLYRETAVLAFAGFEKDVLTGAITRKGNLRRLYEYARTFESGGFKGLYQFVRYVDGIMENKTKLNASEGAEDAVSLITIHHSKGLQYPVCFVSGTASQLNRDDTKPPMLCDERLGCATLLCNAGPFSHTNTFFRKAVEIEIIRQNREEEMRILYVAMTRAQEYLYITGAPAGDIQKLNDRVQTASHPAASFLATSASSYLEWILTALASAKENDFYAQKIRKESSESEGWDEGWEDSRYEQKNADGKGDGAKKTDENSPVGGDNPKRDPEKAPEELLKERFSFRYPYEHLSLLPAKMSVSKLSPTALDVFDRDSAALPEDKEDEAVEKLLATFDRTPRFDKKGPTAAEKGTATHEFLQFCNFDRVKEHGVRWELAYLIEQKFLSPEAEKAVRIQELERFFDSALYRALEQADAKSVHREMRFHIFLPATDFTRNEALSHKIAAEKLAVQGVIDLFFTDSEGRLILCDYKTDRLTPEQLRDPAEAAKELASKHGKQLSYYAKALTEILGRAPDKVLIYSLHLGAALEVPQEA